MNDLIEALRAFDAIRDSGPEAESNEIVRHTLDRRPPAMAPQEDGLQLLPELRQALLDIGVSRLYDHQVRAIAAALRGEDVALTAPTASGKTLCFAVPMIQRLIREPSSHAMMIYPMKAVANDQRRQLDALASRVRGRRKIESWPYDGDTDGEIRKVLRDSPPAVLLTNPEMVHSSFLQWSGSWEKYLKHLDFIVVDEIHEYRGYLGTNMALLLRRLLLKLKRLGVRPQLFLASATCANPLDHARRLTGREFVTIGDESQMRPERHFIFVNPCIPDFYFPRVYPLRVARAALAALSLGLSCIVFCPSRLFTERIFRLATREAEELGLDPDLIVPYRSGYKAEDRREFEEGLRTGRYRLVFCTNALELGIDIGLLDACVLAGFPDSVMSAWQRIGRAGRSWDKTAYVILYGMNNVVDQFYVRNIDSFLQKPLDELAVSVDNEEVISRHLPYLLYEADWTIDKADAELLGQAVADAASKVISERRPVVGGSRPPYMSLDMRGRSDGISRLMYQGHEIGTISGVQQFREAYVGAIYYHMGRKYTVEAHGNNEVHLTDAPPDLRTEAKLYRVVDVDEILRGRRFAEHVSTYYGKLTVYENFAG